MSINNTESKITVFYLGTNLSIEYPFALSHSSAEDVLSLCRNKISKITYIDNNLYHIEILCPFLSKRNKTQTYKTHEILEVSGQVAEDLRSYFKNRIGYPCLAKSPIFFDLLKLLESQCIKSNIKSKMDAAF
jgi:hypothetical protein